MSRRQLSWPVAAALLVLASCVGCAIPCGMVRDDADIRNQQIAEGLRRSADPGGDGYDLTMTLPGSLIDDSFQQILDSGSIPTSRKIEADLALPGLAELPVRFRTDLKSASFRPVAGSPATVEAHLVVRLRGNTDRKIFDVEATVDGPIELFTEYEPGGTPALYLRIGDLERSELAVEGNVLGRGFVETLDGMIPTGGVGRLLDQLGVGNVSEGLEQAANEAARKHCSDLVNALVADSMGDVKVMELAALDLGGLALTPTAVDLATDDKLFAIGLRTDLDTGDGTLALDALGDAPAHKIRLRVSEAFLVKAIEQAYIDEQIPRSFGSKGEPGEDGPYLIEPLGLGLDDQATIDLRVYRCEDPCGWADLRARVRPEAADRDTLEITVDNVEVISSKGAGKLAEMALDHQDRFFGGPLEIVRPISRVMTPEIGGQPLTLHVHRVIAGDDKLTITLTWDDPAAQPGKRGHGKKGADGGRGQNPVGVPKDVHREEETPSQHKKKR